MAWLLVLVPIAGSLGVLAARRRAVAAIAVGALVVLLALAIAASAGSWTGGWSWGPRLQLALSVDGLSRLMVVLVPAVAAPVVAYASAHESRDRALGRLLALLVAFAGAMELVVTASDLLTLLFGWELVAACSWALIAHRWREPGPPRAAAEAFVVTAFGALGLYLASGAAFSSAGSVRFRAVGALEGVPLDVLAAGVLVAAAAKSAQLPFSPWLFAAMEGPTPVSALLHSATMVAAGAYALARLGPALGGAGWFSPTVAALGLATAVAGGLVALLQSDFKRALAGSTTAQYGLILVAVGAGSTFAAGAHLAAHAAFKSLLFLGAGVAIHAAGTGDLARLRLGRALRGAAALFAIGAAALAAVPPLGGAFSKDQILAATTARWPWVAAGVLLAGVLSAAYAGRLSVLGFGPGRASGPPTSSTELGAMAVLAAITVLLGMLWLPAGRDALGEVIGAVPVSAAPWELAASVALVGAAFAAVERLERGGTLFSLGVADGARERVAEWLGLPALGRRVVVEPVLALSFALARFDDRVVDAGVRGAGAVGVAISRLASWWGERGMDGAVVGLGRGTLSGARASRSVDERAVDRAVEGLAAGVAFAGSASRRLQTGLAHRNYVIVAVGVVGVVLAAIVWR